MSNLAIEEQNKIELAEECGLTYTGRNFEGELEFIGTQEEWYKFNKEFNK